jgi:uncharacterized membrane protein YqaE (UPF0057 family)
MTTAVNENKILKIILAFLLPPAAVFASTGLSGQFWLNVVLTILGFWVAGVIHALIVTL